MSERRVSSTLLSRAIDGRCAYRGISLRDAAEEMSVSASTLTRIRKGRLPDVHGFVRICNWLSMDMSAFIEEVDQ